MTDRGLRSVWTDPEKRRWLGFAALVSVYMLVSLYRLSTAVLADELTVAFDTTGAQLGTLHASFFYIYAAMQIPAGVLADRLGSRRTVTLGGIVMSTGAVGFAVANSYPTAFLGRALIGFGGSVLFIAILRFSANWFRPNEFARMSGLTLGVAGVGGILATTPLAVAVEFGGWRRVTLWIAAAGFGFSALAYVVARDSPSQAGLDSIQGVPQPGIESFRAALGNARVVFGELETWLCGLILFIGAGINVTIIGLWGVPYLVQVHGLSVTRASTYTLLGSAGLVVGPPVVGWLSDRLDDRVRVILAGTVLYAVALAVFVAFEQPPLSVVAVAFALTGVLAGANGLTYAVVKERHAATASGVATGAVNTIGFSGPAVFPTLMGYALDTYWTGDTIGGARVYTTFGYRIAFGITVIAAVLAFVAAVWLYRRTREAAAVESPVTA